MDDNKKFYAAIGILLLIIFAASYYIIQEGQKDTYTVLYFSNPDKPLIYFAPSKTIKINFTIENYENQDLEYTYTIKLDDSEMIKKDIVLKDDEIAVISENIFFEGVPENTKVSVQLYRKGFDETYRQIWYEINI